MDVAKQSLKEFMSSKNSFIVPVYQRNYAWKKEHCEKLFDDIAHARNLPNYFLGACVVVSENPNELLLIDGQQRMTSLSILLIAIYDLLKDREIDSASDSLAEEILEDYLVNKRKQDTPEYIRLKQVNYDSHAYQSLLKKDYRRDHRLNEADDYRAFSADIIAGNDIVRNHKMLKTKIRTFCKDNSIDDFWAAFNKVELAVITLKPDHGDKPQLVFETINSTGTPLANADLIRNYVLMDHDRATQTRFFNEYWQPIEQKTRIQKGNNKYESKTTEAIRYYLTCKTGSHISDKAVYDVFKVVYDAMSKAHLKDKGNEANIEYYLQELLRFCQYYHWFAVSCPISEFEEYLAVFREAKQSAPYSYFMHLMDAYDSYEKDNTTGLDKQTVITALQFTTDYFIRRQLCVELSSRQYLSLYPNLIKKLRECLQSDYITELYEFFANQPRETRYIGKAELIDVLQTDTFYDRKPSTVSKMVLEQLCNADSKEKITIDKTITIEHVMPQTLNPDWRNMLGENYQQVHNDYLHVLGNVTLTGYNSEYSNKSFADKKALFLEYSNIPLNDYFKDIDKWDEEEIKKRGKILAEKLHSIYGGKRYNLDDYKTNPIGGYQTIESAQTTNKKFEPIYLLAGEVHTCEPRWIALFISVLEKLYKKDADAFKQFADSRSNIFSRGEGSLRMPKKVIDDWYVESNENSQRLIKVLSEMLAEYNMTGQLQIKLQ